MVHVTDLHATILEAAGVELPGGIGNSLSFYPLLSGAETTSRSYNFWEVVNNRNTNRSGWAIRNDRYKLINFNSGTQEFYDLAADSLETTDLLRTGLTTDLQAVKADLEAEAAVRQTGWSCRDHIQNGDETGIDCGTNACGTCTTSTEEALPEFPFTVYPNPFTDVLHFGARTPVQGTLEISNMAGQVVLRRALAPTVRVDGLVPGVYRLTVFVDGGWGSRLVVRR